MKTKLSEKRYYSIGEVASSFKVKPSLIRFWEQELKILNPKKNSKTLQRLIKNRLKIDADF